MSKRQALWQLPAMDPFLAEPELSVIAAANIRWEAARYGLSQQDLADFLRRSRSAVSQRFTGRVPWSLDDLGTIAAAMAVKPGYLLEDPVPGAWQLAGH